MNEGVGQMETVHGMNADEVTVIVIWAGTGPAAPLIREHTTVKCDSSASSLVHIL